MEPVSEKRLKMTATPREVPIRAPRKTTAIRKTSVRKSAVPQPELAQEQKYADNAYEVYLRSLEATQGARNNPSSTAADHRAKLKSLPGEPPLSDRDPIAFGWAEDGKGNRFYVGKTSVLDESKNPLVVNWKSPLGDRYMGAIAGDDRGLAQKRTFTTDARTILSYSDTRFSKHPMDARDESTPGVSAPDTLEHTSADSTYKIDDAVLSSMESNRDSSMHDIVATIQADQYRVLTHAPDAALLIQGGPGTGKTAVALHRLSWLLYNQQDSLSPSDVLVVTPSPTLTRYIRSVLPSLGDEGIRQIAIQELTREVATVGAQEMRDVSALKSDARFRDVIRHGLRQRIGLIGERLVFRRKASRDTAHLDAAAVEQAYLSYVHMPYLIGRRAFLQHLRNELVDRYPLPRRGSFEDSYDLQTFTAQADRVWPTLSAHRFLHDLLSSKRRLAEASKEIFTDDEVQKLARTTADSLSDEKWTEADTFLLHEVQAQLDPTSLQRFGHIVVDEAQDLTGMQVQAIKRRSKSGAMTLSGDIAQSTGSTRRDSWDSLFTILVDQEPGQSWSIDGVDRKTLKFVYRVPREAQALANALQPEVAPSLDVPESLRTSGYDPQFLRAEQGRLSRSVGDAVARHREDGLMVGVIAPDQLHSAVAQGLKDKGITFVHARSGELSDEVTIVSPAGAKGLEFDAVVIVDPQRIYTMEAGPRLLYIALTRTTSRLDLVFADEQVPELLRPLVNLPDPPSAEASAIDGHLSAPAVAETVVNSGETREGGAALTAPDESSDQSTASMHETPTGTTAPSVTARTSGSAGVLEERFVSMSAGLYLGEIRAQVRPELVQKVVQQMLAMLSEAGESTDAST